VENVILLNQDYSFMKIVDWQKAVTLLFQNKVEVVEYSKREVRNYDSSYVIKIPKVMKLIKYIKNFYKKMTIKFNRKNIFLRDNFECGYCLSPGNNKNKLTIDHIMPRCRNGEHSFENTVTCCNSCNGKKKNKTPEEAGMVLKKRIYEPTFYDLFKDKVSMYIKK